jgi:hypothetical protein
MDKVSSIPFILGMLIFAKTTSTLLVSRSVRASALVKSASISGEDHSQYLKVCRKLNNGDLAFRLWEVLTIYVAGPPSAGYQFRLKMEDKQGNFQMAWSRYL